MAEYDLFPSLIPDDEQDLTKDDVRELFNDDHKLLRKAIAQIGKDTQNELPVNGKSTQVELLSWMAENMTRKGLESYANMVEKDE
jgi:hypothetical protein